LVVVVVVGGGGGRGLRPKHRVLSTWLLVTERVLIGLVGLIQTSMWILVWTPIGQQFGKCMSGKGKGVQGRISYNW